MTKQPSSLTWVLFSPPVVAVAVVLFAHFFLIRLSS